MTPVKPCPLCGVSVVVDEGWIIHPDGDCALAGYEFSDARLSDEDNAARWNRRVEPAEVKPTWRCFFCEEVFTDRAAAAQHFGVSEEQTPACRIAGADGGLVRVLRETEDALYRATAALHDESADTIRTWRGMLSRHATALRLAEESGYEKGLADGRLSQQQRGSDDESTEGQPDRGVGDYDGGSAGGLGGDTAAAGVAGSGG